MIFLKDFAGFNAATISGTDPQDNINVELYSSNLATIYFKIVWGESRVCKIKYKVLKSNVIPFSVPSTFATYSLLICTC